MADLSSIPGPLGLPPKLFAKLRYRKQREFFSCGLQLQHKWSRQDKYLLASVDVENPHADINDQENSVLLKSQTMICSMKHWMVTLELLWTRKRSRKQGSYEKMHVFDKVPIAQCWERTSKAPLKARWVDIDKGTRYRSRWVAKQFKGSDSEEWFAATPPIEALRALISHTTSGPKKKALMVCDVSRAFFHAPVQHEISVELCEEAKKTLEDNNMCAKQRISMYGTMAAAQNWQKKVQETMATLGFSIGEASPVLFCHPQRSLCQENQSILFGCETSWSLSWKSTLQYLVTKQECRRR